MTRTETAAPAAPTAFADPTAGFRRASSSLALPLGIVAQLVANLAYALATMSGGDDSTGANALELYSRESGLAQLATVSVVLGAILLVPGLPAALRVLRPTRPRLSLIAVILMLVGYLCYAVVAGSNWITIALGQAGLDAGDAIDAAQQMPTSTPLFLLFILGNLGGTLLLGLAVLLSRGLPKIAGVLVIAWPVLHVTGLVVGSEWFEVTGAALEAAGLAILASIALRLPLAEWRSRG